MPTRGGWERVDGDQVTPRQAQKRRKKYASEALNRKRSMDSCRRAFWALRTTSFVVLAAVVAVNVKVLHGKLHRHHLLADAATVRAWDSPLLRLIGSAYTRLFATICCGLLACVEAEWRAATEHFRVVRRSPLVKSLLMMYVALVTASEAKPLREYSLPNLAAWLMLGLAGVHLLVGLCFQRYVDEAMRAWRKRTLAKQGKKLRKRRDKRSPMPSEHGSDASFETRSGYSSPAVTESTADIGGDADVGYMPDWARGDLDGAERGGIRSYQMGGFGR